MLKATILAAAVATMFTGAAFAGGYGYGGGYGHSRSYDAYIYEPAFKITASYDDDYEYEEWGKYCYTDVGLIGPGKSMPLGADCSVWTEYGDIEGYVAAASENWGTYCHTSYGDAGPFKKKLVGSWCVIRTSYGDIHGYIIEGDDY